MRVLVTGGSGFVGAPIARALAGRGDVVTVFDSFATGASSTLGSLAGVEIVPGDIRDRAALEGVVVSRGVERIVHTAAVVGTPLSMKDPLLTAEVNLLGSINVLEVARQYELERVVDLSSEEVYGAFQYEPADEEHPLAPYSPYGITKTAAEWYAGYYHRCYGVNCLTLRTSWVYGPGLAKDRSPRNFLRRALDGQSLSLPGGGDQRLDHTHIDDLVQGVLLALDKERPQYRVYNIASGEGYSLAGVAELVRELVPGAAIAIGPGLLEFAPGFYSPQKGALDIRRAAADLGYQPTHDLKHGLVKYLEHLQA